MNSKYLKAFLELESYSMKDDQQHLWEKIAGVFLYVRLFLVRKGNIEKYFHMNAADNLSEKRWWTIDHLLIHRVLGNPPGGVAILILELLFGYSLPLC